MRSKILIQKPRTSTVKKNNKVVKMLYHQPHILENMSTKDL